MCVCVFSIGTSLRSQCFTLFLSFSWSSPIRRYEISLHVSCSVCSVLIGLDDNYYNFFIFWQVVNVTGNQDICYYNFLCAHPLGALRCVCVCAHSSDILNKLVDTNQSKSMSFNNCSDCKRIRTHRGTRAYVSQRWYSVKVLVTWPTHKKNDTIGITFKSVFSSWWTIKNSQSECIL